jgi:hypothetical protein
MPETIEPARFSRLVQKITRHDGEAMKEIELTDGPLFSAAPAANAPSHIPPRHTETYTWKCYISIIISVMNDLPNGFPGSNFAVFQTFSVLPTSAAVNFLKVISSSGGPALRCRRRLSKSKTDLYH